MTALAVALMVTGALLLIAEAHLASYGLLGVAGTLALLGGGVLAVSEAGAWCSRSPFRCRSPSASSR
jgi:membrane-bound ClpP family serine protease